MEQLFAMTSGKRLKHACQSEWPHMILVQTCHGVHTLTISFHRNYGATDCPKNAHLIPEWENLDEEVELARRANATSIIDEGDLASLMRVA